MLNFITGNKNKFFELTQALAPIQIKQLDLDLVEIQEIDSNKVIEHKLREALKAKRGSLIIDDSALYLECFNYELPGPLIKWFNKTLGTRGIYEMCKKMGKFGARAETRIGLAESDGKITIFKGLVKGKIVAPRGVYNFGYDPLVLPKGSKLTLSQLKDKGLFHKSPRGKAAGKLKKYLQENF